VNLRLGEHGAARGRYEEALGIYREIGDRLGEANCIKALGDLWADQEEVEKALAFLDEAEARFSALGLPAYVAWVHNSRGNLWHRREDYAAAVEAYTRAIQAWPQEGAFYRNRADTFIEMGDFAAAAADLEQAATLAPEHPYLALRRAQLAFYMRDYSSALRHAQEALARRSPFAPAALLAALAHLALGDEGEATRALETAIQGPHDKEDLEDALRWLERLPETVPPEAVERFRERLREALNRFRPR
jgi:tetratricopeptide (TPR) repeat protein